MRPFFFCIIPCHHWRNTSEYNKECLINQANKCTQLSLEAKEQNIVKMDAKPDNPKMTPKTYRSILSRFWNNKKIPIIPFLFVEGKLISNFKKKAELFNSHFAVQCTVVNNTNNTNALPGLQLRTNHRLNHFTINPCQTNVPFLYPLKTSENKGFLTFSGGIEREGWPEMG